MNRPRIGLSACIFHPDPERPIFKGKSLLYAEESMMGWVAEHGGMPLCLPRPIMGLENGEILDAVDGLLLQGGVDMSPSSYAEAPISDAWLGDKARDDYEITLVRDALERGIPVLAVCRGVQVLNVALGGSLYQDLQTQIPEAREHRNAEVYDGLHHDIDLVADGALAEIYPGVSRVRVNSVHHQGLKKVSDRLRVEAASVEDGVVEGVSLKGTKNWCIGVQWHPEFIDARFPDLLNRGPLMRAFLRACETKRVGGNHGTA